MASNPDVLKDLLNRMVQTGASDLHLRSDGPLYLRVDGQLNSVEETRFSPEELQGILNGLMSLRHREIYERTLEVDFSYSLPNVGRFRCNGYWENGRPAAVVRRVPHQVPDFETLLLPSVIKSLAEQKWGLILVTGPTGNGKSTSLASIVDFINTARLGHIVTIEDPVEFVYRSKKCAVSQREVGNDTLGFAAALKHVLRQDPNVIVVGEMRDLETVETVLQAAETGHLVLSTLHTSDAVQTINRIIDMFPADQQTQARIQLSGVLKGVLSQKLLPRVGGGRVPACEVLINTGFVKTAILKNESSDIEKAIREGAHYGMQSFHQSLLKLLNDKVVRLEDAVEAATNPDELMLAVKGIDSGLGSINRF